MSGKTGLMTWGHQHQFYSRQRSRSLPFERERMVITSTQQWTTRNGKLTNANIGVSTSNHSDINGDNQILRINHEFLSNWGIHMNKYQLVGYHTVSTTLYDHIPPICAGIVNWHWHCGNPYNPVSIPVVPHKAVAEVSKIGNYRRGELLWCMYGRANPLMDRNVVGFVFFGVVTVVTSPTTAECSVVWCGVVCSCTCSYSFSCSCSGSCSFSVVIVVAVVVVAVVVVAVVVVAVVVVVVLLNVGVVAVALVVVVVV